MLQALSFLSYSAEPSNYSEAVRIILRHCNTADDKICRVALVSLGNLHRPDCSDLVFRHVVDLLLKMTQSPGSVPLSRLKLLMSAMQVLSQVLPSVDQLDPAYVANLFFAIQKLLTLGSCLKPFLDVSGTISSSSDQSDAESSMSYTDKVLSKLRTCSLISLQELFKKHSKLLFSYWGSLFAERRDDRQMSLNYLLSQEHTKTIVAYTIGVIIDNSPLSKWVFNMNESTKGNKGFTPFSQSVAAIVKILHEDLSTELLHECNSHTLTALLKASTALLSQCPYVKMPPGLVRPLAQALVGKWEHCDSANRGNLLQAFNVVLQANQTEVEDLFSKAVVDDILSTFEVSEPSDSFTAKSSKSLSMTSSLYNRELHLERMAVAAKLAKFFPHKLEDSAVVELVQANLKINDAKLTSATLLILEELTKNPGLLAEFASEVFIKHIRTPNSAASCLSLITCIFSSSAIDSVTCKSKVQQCCIEFLENCNSRAPESVAIRTALFKFCTAYTKHPLCDENTYRTVLSLLKKFKDDSSLAVSIQASAALAAACSSSFVESFVQDLVELAMLRSNSKKEKIASNGVVAIGNILENACFSSLQPTLDSLFNLLIESCTHKNIKVCWDSCKALLKAASRGLLKSHDFRIAEELLRILNHHPNFKTRVYLVQLLESFAEVLAENFSESASLLLSSISAENPADASSYTEQKHKIEFKQASLRLLATLSSKLRDDSDISAFMNLNAGSLCSELHESLSLYVHSSGAPLDEMLESPIVQLYKQAGKRLHYHAESEGAQVSFGTVERFADLANFSIENAAQLLSYSNVSDDVNIGLKSQLTQNLP
mmetsp:Transcript_1906/g.4219  ORF Transcript_1906/g.4219 Transcript_1906/m.4219 type:complete len:829 (+) Transcript_1906:157-2643(+)